MHRVRVCTLLTLFIVLNGGVRLNVEDTLRTRALKSQLANGHWIGTRARTHNARLTASGFRCSTVDNIFFSEGKGGSVPVMLAAGRDGNTESRKDMTYNAFWGDCVLSYAGFG